MKQEHLWIDFPSLFPFHSYWDGLPDATNFVITSIWKSLSLQSTSLQNKEVLL